MLKRHGFTSETMSGVELSGNAFNASTPQRACWRDGRDGQMWRQEALHGSAGPCAQRLRGMGWLMFVRQAALRED